MSVANIIQLLILLVGGATVGWFVYSALCAKIDTIETNVQKKIDRVYTRQDEEIKLVTDSQKESVNKIEKEFMRIDAHNLSIEHMKEIMELKSNTTIQLFNTRLDNLANNVKELIDRYSHR